MGQRNLKLPNREQGKEGRRARRPAQGRGQRQEGTSQGPFQISLAQSEPLPTYLSRDPQLEWLRLSLCHTLDTRPVCGSRQAGKSYTSIDGVEEREMRKSRRRRSTLPKKPLVPSSASRNWRRAWRRRQPVLQRATRS